MGAGVIPFSVHKQQVQFLFQTVFSGRKSGYLIDFGGGINQGENYQQAAAREFIEETETMFFAKDAEEIMRARKTPERVAGQMPVINQLFEHTLQRYPGWVCRREPGNSIPPKDWKTYFIEVTYRDVTLLNQQWILDAEQLQRFSKRRELRWIDADQLLYFYDHQPERLWKRVRQLINAGQVVRKIKQEKLSSLAP